MNFQLPGKLSDRLKEWFKGNGNLVVLTGAGISAESGIPTFRGKEGYWTVGSKEYHPQEMATHAMFSSHPETVWTWYLYRRSICNRANPNAGHHALVELEKKLGRRFQLITQNVDGLHLRAGNTPENIFQIHGNINYARCSNECRQQTWLLPDSLPLERSKETPLSAEDVSLLRCPYCGAWARPHILWFDEFYNEEYYHFESSIEMAIDADVLLVVGTSGATNLPMQIGYRAAQNNALIIDVNIESNPFARLAEESGGYFLQGPGATVLPGIVRVFKDN